MEIVVIKRGKEMARLPLEEGKEYLAGRADDCAIRLEGEQGISRHHVKFSQQNGIWVAQLISKYGALIYQGDSIQTLELQEGVRFVIPPYEFAVVEPKVFAATPRAETALVVHPAARKSNAAIPTVETLLEGSFADSEDGDTFGGNIEATKAGIPNLEALLKVRHGKPPKSETIRLEGNYWIIGRDANCDIVIENKSMSRKHFELRRESSGFTIRDLGSANGTALNGKRMEPEASQKLLSGDKITIRDVRIHFEMRDPSFQAKMSLVPVVEDIPEMPLDGSESFLPPAIYNDPIGGFPVGRVERISQEDSPLKRGFKNNQPKIVLGVIAVVVVVVAVLSSGGKTEKAQQETTSTSTDTAVTFDKLTDEKRAIVRDTFNLAHNLYMSGKYELCLQELKKLHELVPFYENSKELVNLCLQASELARIQADKAYRQEQQLKREKEIQTIAEACHEKLAKNPGLTEAELQACIAPAIELDPQNAQILELVNQLKIRQEERDSLARASSERAQKERLAIELYNRAKRFVQTGRLRDAIDEYERLINSGYPDAGGVREKAQREIASVRKDLSTKVAQLLTTCQEAIEKARFRAGYDACLAASTEDPKNAEVQASLKRALSELRREMKAVYEDSTLEESVGNIDAAKEKWKHLMREDLPNDDYYIKAKLKLQKYGVGI